MAKNVAMLLCVFLFGGGVFAQTDTLITQDTSATTLTTTIPVEQPIEVVSAEAKKKTTKKYQVAAAVASMLFIGLLLVSVQTFNPE